MSVPNVGLTKLLEYMFGVTTASTPYVAVGAETTPPAAGDTALESERARVLASVVSVSENRATIKGFFTTSQANDGKVCETGLLTGSDPVTDPGTLLDRSLNTSTQDKDSSKEMIVEYTVTLERGDSS